MTKFNVSHERKQSEDKRSWLFSREMGVVIVVVATLISAYSTYPEEMSTEILFCWLWSWGFFTAIHTLQLCVLYLAIAWLVARLRTNRRKSYMGSTKRTTATMCSVSLVVVIMATVILPPIVFMVFGIIFSLLKLMIG